MAAVNFQEGVYIPAAACPDIKQNKLVECSIGITNTGSARIRPGAFILAFFYAPTLSSRTGDYQADEKTWSDDVGTYGGIGSEAKSDQSINSGETLTFVFTVLASEIPLGRIDAGFVLKLDPNLDGIIDMYSDSLLVDDAFKIVEPQWAAELGEASFAEA